MKIYFSASIRGGREYQYLYSQIINLLGNYGEVLTEHIGREDLSSFGDTHLSEQAIYDRDMSWLNEADLVVAEISTPSLGVGYEIAKVENEKPVICLFREDPTKSLSAMLAGNPYIKVKKYSNFSEVQKIIEAFISTSISN